MLLGSLLLMISGAQAQQTGFDAHGLDLAPLTGDIRAPLMLQRAASFKGGDGFMGVLGEYAHRPLVRTVVAGDTVVDEQGIVESLGALNLSLGVAAHERLRFDVHAPVILGTIGDAGLEGPAMGDVRVTTMVSILRPVDTRGFGVAATGHVDVPSGDVERFLGRGKVGGGGTLVANAEVGSAFFTANLGAQFDPTHTDANLINSDSLRSGLGVGGLLSNSTSAQLEWLLASPFQKNPIEGSGVGSELIASLRARQDSGAFFTMGGAMGLTQGVGVPALRLFVGGGWGSGQDEYVPDSDPITQLMATDLCPAEREVVNGYRDEDGCPDSLGSLSIDVRYKDRPWSAEAEISGPEGLEKVVIGRGGIQRDAIPGSQWIVSAIADTCLVGFAEATVEEAQGSQLLVELTEDFNAQVGILVQTPDGTPVPDARISWYSEALPFCVPGETAITDATGAVQQDISKGEHMLTVTAENYGAYMETLVFEKGDAKNIIVTLEPSKVRIEKERIVIEDKVFFETGKAVIKSASFGLLDEVAGVILSHPEVGRIEVAGHTDSRGSESFNQKLSQDRAESVRQYLIDKGVEAERLVAKGYGESDPIETNRTEAGREKNRRVEFNLIDQKQEESP